MRNAERMKKTFMRIHAPGRNVSTPTCHSMNTTML